MDNVIKLGTVAVVGLTMWLLASAVQADDDALPGVSALSAEELVSSNGRQGVPVQWQVNNNEQNALLTNNVLSGTVVNGNNVISDHAFDNMNGVATVIQNSGNQVVIQDSTQINILFNN